MTEFRYEPPRDLRRRLKLGREEFVQRLITSLILGGPYPPWNSRNQPSTDGLRFLERLHGLTFNDGWEGDGCEFVDELELPARTADDRSGAPDWAAVWPNRVWVIELKTEVASHRAAQVPTYLDLAHHNFPGRNVDLTYLTPPMTADYKPVGGRGRYGHVTWGPVAELITEIWGGSERTDQQAVVDGIVAALNALDEKPSPWLDEFRSHMTWDETIGECLARAEATAVDQVQCAADVRFSGLDELFAARDAVNARLAATPADSPHRHVRAWKWETSTTGAALTAAGEAAGMELRFSYYERAQW